MSQSQNEAAIFELQCMQRLESFVNAIEIDLDMEEPFVEANLPLKSDPDYGEEEPWVFKRNCRALC